MALVKICGITNTEDAKLAQENKVDFLGFIFYKKSPRFIQPAQAKKIISKLKPRVHAVGVFVNVSLKEVERITSYCNIDIVQLHGNESASYCRALIKKGFRVIKAVRVKNKGSLSGLDNFHAHALLFDTFDRSLFGGTGRSFNHELVRRNFSLPVIISGGIDQRNVKSVINRLKPYAVDASSSLERFPGKKDKNKLAEFLRLVKDKTTELR